MSDLEEIKKKVTNRVEKVNHALDNTAELVKLTPILQKQKEDDEATLALLNELPADFAEENAHVWLTLENETDKLLGTYMPMVPYIKPGTEQALSGSSSGTATPYFTSASGLVASYIGRPDPHPEWVDRVTVVMDEHTRRISQREYIPSRFDLLNRDLGKMFTVAMQSFSKCQNGILGVDNCGIHLRDVIQQVWGGLVKLAVTKNTLRGVQPKDLRLKKQGDRAVMAEILATPTFPKVKLRAILDDLYDLHFNLSKTDFGKNNLNKDFPLLKTYFTQWLSDMDAISAIVT